jgi:single-strand DNA-binding protein
MISKGSLNRATILGHLVYDPELKEISPGVSRCRLVVATNRKWKTESGEIKEETEFHRIVAWQKLAELCGQLLSKGKKVYIEGRLSTHEWDTPDGQKKKETEIVMDDMIVTDQSKVAEPIS